MSAYITTDDNDGDEVEWTWGQKPEDSEDD